LQQTIQQESSVIPKQHFTMFIETLFSKMQDLQGNGTAHYFK